MAGRGCLLRSWLKLVSAVVFVKTGLGSVAAPLILLSQRQSCNEVVHRQSGLLSEEQEVGCEAGRGVRRVVVRLDQLRQMDGPPGLLLRRQRTQQTVHGAVETLALGVSLRVVRRRSGLLDVVGVAQLFHQTGLEVSSLVAVDPFRNTVPLKPFMDQDFGDGGGFLVPGGYGLRELGENVRHDKDVFSAVAGLV